MHRWNRHSILHETEDWIAVNKPIGIASVAERDTTQSSLVKKLEREIGTKLWVVHRLDKDTRGVILYLKNRESHRHFSLLFQERHVSKTYLAFVWGAPFPQSGTITNELHISKNGKASISNKGKPTTTKYQVLETFGLVSLVSFQPITGRTHQIRVHAKHLGHPIVADTLYSNGKAFFLSDIKRPYHLQKQKKEQPLIQHLALHCSNLSFTYRNETYSINAPLFKDMQATLSQLQKLV